METFILLAVLFLVFGGCSRGCRRRVRRARDRVLEGADGLQEALGSGDAGRRSGPAGSGWSGRDRARSARGRSGKPPPSRASGHAPRGGRRRGAGRGASRSAGQGAGGRGGSGRGADGGRPSDAPDRMSPDDPRRLAILKDRFVRGELTMEEYEREVDKLDLRL